MTELSFDRVAVFGAGGPTGSYICDQLLGRRSAVRGVARNKERLDQVFADTGVETLSADALDADAVERAVTGCDLVVDCIGLPADRMADHPRTARNIAHAARNAGARCLQVSSYWAYLPIIRLPLTEAHPRRGGVDYVRLRREAEDIMEGTGAAVVNLPDFYGPRVHTSTLQQALTEALADKPMSWIGRADTPHEYAYVPDAARTIVELAHRREAYGQRWIVAGAGPLTADETAKIASDALGRNVKVRAAGVWMLRLLGLFMSELRQFLPMVPYYVEPISYDSTRLVDLIGEQPTTPYADGVSATLDWLRDV